MRVLRLLTCPRKDKYKVASVSDDAAEMSDDYESSYLKVEHLTPVINVNRQSCSIKCGIVALVLIISLSLNVVVSIYLWRNWGKTDQANQAPYTDGIVSAVHGDSICTECSPLGIRPESAASVTYHDLSIHRINDGLNLCCIHNAAGLRSLVYLFADRYHLHPPLENYEPADNQSRTGAHLYINSQALDYSSPKLSWTKGYGFGSAYNSDDVIIDDNRLRIPRSGLYHVYSFITFKTEQPRSRPDNVVHTINRKNKHHPELGSHVILIDKTTLPEVSERFMTSFLSATVRLRQDDQIRVEVSNLSYVYRFAPSNFFGLYFVGE